MKNNNLQENFINIIKECVSERGKLANTLVDLLFIEKEAVYRRLRGEVSFTFDEIAVLAKKFNISLDSLLGTSSPKSKPFHLKINDNYKPAEIDYAMMQEFVDVVKTAQDGLFSEYGYATNVIPLYFTSKYQLLNRVLLLKWAYQQRNPGLKIPFSEIKPTERYVEIANEFVYAAESITSTFFILDKLLLLYFVNDINYFHNIRLITPNEVDELKNELLAFLDDFEQLATIGSFANGNKVRIYVANVNFESSYSYLETSIVNLTLVRVFTINEVSSLDKDVFLKMKTWMQTLKRTSTLISGSNEKERIAFFDSQREFVNSQLMS